MDELLQRDLRGFVEVEQPCHSPIRQLVYSREVSFLDASGVIATGASAGEPMTLGFVESNLLARAKFVSQCEEPSRHSLIKFTQPRVATDCYLVRCLGIPAIEALCVSGKCPQNGNEHGDAKDKAHVRCLHHH
jgi:hypothetical protein